MKMKSAEGSATSRLKRRWPDLNQVERGAALQALVDAGMSRRRIARMLTVTEGTVRRHLRIADLGVADRDKIAAGASAKDILNRERLAMLSVQQQRRTEQEAADEAVSTAVASLLVDWLNSVRLHGAYVQQLFEEVRLQIRSREYWAPRYPSRLVLPVPLYDLANAAAMIRRSEPSKTEFPFELARLAEWLKRWLPRVAVDEVCRERALRKALAVAQAN